MDADSEAIDAGKDQRSPVNLVQSDACRLPFEASFFDKVLAVHLLEHISEPNGAVGEMARVLKPAGRAVIVVPCERIRGDTAFAGWLRFQNLHLHRFTPSSISQLLSKHFSIEVAMFHTLIPGRFKPMPLDRTPLLYYYSLAMILQLKKM